MPLFGLPSELLTQISSYFVGNELIHLEMTGNRALNSKLRRTSTITVQWKASRFCDWDACLPFVEAFSDLQTLTLSTSMPIHRSHRLLKLGNLPSSLTSLSLHYYGAVDHFSEDQSLSRLSSLTYLSVRQLTGTDKRSSSVLKLDSLPASLQHLYIHMDDQGGLVTYRIVEAEAFLSGLLTFDVNLPLMVPYNAVLSKAWPLFKTNRSLTHLGICSHRWLDISHVGPSLRHLQLYCGQIKDGNGHSPLHFGTPTGTPIRTLLPHLHTLILAQDSQFSWDVLETLPPTLTRLGGDFSIAQVDVILATCARLNEAYRASLTSGSEADRPGAPMMLRKLEISQYFLLDLADLVLPYFSSLESLQENISPTRCPVGLLPPNIREFEGRQLYGHVSLLPRSLTSISCRDLLIDELTSDEANSSSTRLDLEHPPASQFPSLVLLSIRNSVLTTLLVSLLPRTLEQLKVAVHDSKVLACLGRRVDVELSLPRLKSLSLNLYPQRGQYEDGRFYIPLDLLPMSIDTLTLKGVYRLAPAQQPMSLAHHPSLTSLTLRQYEEPSKVLPHLPKQLLHMDVALSLPLDLNDPKIVNMMFDLPRNLKSVRFGIETRNVGETTNWFVPVRRSSRWSFPSLWTARNRSEKHLMFIQSLPRSIASDSLLFVVSEYFALSCLPVTTVQLNVKTYPFSSIEGTLPIGSVTWMLDTWLWENPKWRVMRFCASRLPLLGLCFPSQFLPTESDKAHAESCYQQMRSMAFPKNLSHLIDRGSKHPLNNIPPSPEDLAFVSASRVVFNASHFVSCAILFWALHLDRQSHPIAWALQWMNLIGSLASLSAHAYRQSYPWSRTILRGTLLLIPIFIPIFVSTNYGAAIALGYAPSRYGNVTRVTMGAVTIAGECILSFISRLLFRAY